MARLSSIILFFALCSVTVGAATEEDLIELHKNASNLRSEECLPCHDRILIKERSLNKRPLTFHKVHLESRLQTPKDCTYCHQFLGLKEGAISALKEPVDPGICTRCH